MSAVISEPPCGACEAATLPTESWWCGFFNAAPDAHVVCRNDGLVEQVNPRAARSLRLDRAASEGSLCLFDILAAPADRKLAEVLRLGLLHPETLHSVTTVVDGRPQSLADLEITPLGRTHSLITFKDAARRLRLETHVSRLVTAIDATPVVFFLTDASCQITYVNPAFHAVTGYGIETVLDRTDEFLRAPSECPKVEDYLKAVTGGKEWIGELVNVRADGSTYLVEATLSPICDITGEFIGYVACERDITAQKRLEGDLRLERDFVGSILHSLEGVIYALDREFRITQTNSGWKTFACAHGGVRLDGPPEVGRQFFDYIPDPAGRAELCLTCQQVLNTGQALDSAYASPDGRHWMVKISPWVHVTKVIGLIVNITDQTHFHELQNQLFQAQKMEIIGTLAAGVAHDFNNLLQAIRGNNGLVLREIPPDSKLRRFAEQVQLASTRAADVTKQLLSFSRSTEERKTVVDLNSLIQEAAQLARRTLRGNVTLEINPARGALRVKVDSTRASQALLNLCVNAQDAMPKGGKLTLTNVRLELPYETAFQHCVKEGAEYVRCSVADTGTGIPPELLRRIFEPFFTTKEAGKGTGLGLPIVQRVMKEAGGFMEVESLVGAGTTFHLYFPLATEELTAEPEGGTQILARGAGRVLVVDDLDLVRDFTRNFLESTGLTVLVAADAQQAVQMLEKLEGQVELLFTDYNMPGMSGIELIELVGQRWPAIGCVLATGYLDEHAGKRVTELRATVLNKPYEMRKASGTIMQLLARRKAGA